MNPQPQIRDPFLASLLAAGQAALISQYADKEPQS